MIAPPTASAPLDELLRPHAYLYAEKQHLRRGEYAALMDRLERRVRWAPRFSAALALLALGRLVLTASTFAREAVASGHLPETWVVALSVATDFVWLLFAGFVLHEWGRTRSAIHLGRLLLASEAPATLPAAPPRG